MIWLSTPGQGINVTHESRQFHGLVSIIGVMGDEAFREGELYKVRIAFSPEQIYERGPYSDYLLLGDDI